jgi:hypothetical protein
MSAEKSPIKRESIALSLCYCEKIYECHALPEAQREGSAGLDRHAGCRKAIQAQKGGN